MSWILGLLRLGIHLDNYQLLIECAELYLDKQIGTPLSWRGEELFSTGSCRATLMLANWLLAWPDSIDDKSLQLHTTLFKKGSG